MKHYTFFLVLVATFVSETLRAQAPPLINYQGRVAVDAVNFQGAGQFKFALVDSDGSTTLWSNDGTSVNGSEPGAAVSLTVVNGLYSVLLGDSALANMGAIPVIVFANPDVRLRVWFDDGTNGSQLLTPDQRLAPSPYLADGTVTTASLADGAVTTEKIAAGAVTGASIALASVDGTNIAAGSLDFSHLTVPAAPTAGQVLGFDGKSLNWSAPGAGDGIWTLSGTTATYGNGVRIGDILSWTDLTTGFPPSAITNANGTLYFRMPQGGNVVTAAYVDSSGMVVRGREVLEGFEPFLTWNDTNSGRTATIGSANGTLYYRVPNAANNIVTAGYVDSNGMVVNGDVHATRLNLKADPAAPTNAAVLCGDAAVTTFVPFNTATNRALDLIVSDASVRVLTIRGGADLAEPFPMSQKSVPSGAVVSIDPEHPGQLKMSARAYDKKVAGIVSGANGIKPGISMIDEQQLDPGENVALSGRVYVKANNSAGQIQPGDLLTTSDVPGEAMKAADHERAQGSILGKAMTELNQATGTVLVLVTLQ